MYARRVHKVKKKNCFDTLAVFLCLTIMEDVILCIQQRYLRSRLNYMHNSCYLEQPAYINIFELIQNRVLCTTHMKPGLATPKKN